jgi:hypothetical protein
LKSTPQPHILAPMSATSCQDSKNSLRQLYIQSETVSALDALLPSVLDKHSKENFCDNW